MVRSIKKNSAINLEIPPDAESISLCRHGQCMRLVWARGLDQCEEDC